MCCRDVNGSLFQTQDPRDPRIFRPTTQWPIRKRDPSWPTWPIGRWRQFFSVTFTFRKSRFDLYKIIQIASKALQNSILITGVIILGTSNVLLVAHTQLAEGATTNRGKNSSCKNIVRYFSQMFTWMSDPMWPGGKFRTYPSWPTFTYRQETQTSVVYFSRKTVLYNVGYKYILVSQYIRFLHWGANTSARPRPTPPDQNTIIYAFTAFHRHQNGKGTLQSMIQTI
jgi:hypothetical protein